MSHMQANNVLKLADTRDRRRRLQLAVAARRRLADRRTTGRVWINGAEVGGTDPRFRHLGESHD